jgi:hypothetical protein
MLAPVLGAFLTWREQFLAQTARARVPAIFHAREFAAHGGLLSYGASITEAFRLHLLRCTLVANGTKRTSIPSVLMSAFGGKADISRNAENVAFDPSQHFGRVICCGAQCDRFRSLS